MYNADRDGNKVTTVVATPGAGPDRPQEISYTDTKVIGNGSFGVVYLAKLCDTEELVAIKKVLQDKRFKVREKLSYVCIYIDSSRQIVLKNDDIPNLNRYLLSRTCNVASCR